AGGPDSRAGAGGVARRTRAARTGRLRDRPKAAGSRDRETPAAGRAFPVAGNGKRRRPSRRAPATARGRNAAPGSPGGARGIAATLGGGWSPGFSRPVFRLKPGLQRRRVLQARWVGVGVPALAGLCSG